MEFVQLPCKTTVHLPEDAKVEWTDSYATKVHVYRNTSGQLEEQNQVYRHRTKMNVDLLKTGDLSLTLTQPTERDTDTYTCTVYSKEGNILMIKQVELKFRVEPIWAVAKPISQDNLCEESTYIIWLAPCSSVVFALLFYIIFDLCHRYRRLKDKEVLLLSVPKKLEKREGVKSVLLPCKTKVHLPKDVTVEWRCSGSRNMLVHKYQNGQNQPEQQDQIYQGRTEMNENALKTGNLSLTLKHLCLNDRGAYTCTVYKKNRKILLEKVVALWVKELPDLLSIYTKQCKTNVREIMMDLSHPNNGLFSLLRSGKRFRPLEAKKGIMMMSFFPQAIQALNQEEVVEVTEADKSVLLPFKTTAHLPGDATVEWRCSDSKNMMVHVYQNGQNQPDKQDEVYRGHTEMEEDPLRTGDLSLTLKDVHLTDSVYTCTVYSKDGHILRQKVVDIWFCAYELSALGYVFEDYTTESDWVHSPKCDKRRIVECQRN
ncbi:hypothetical protein ACER0C_002888 [Sarotherodon galilaeus]